MQIDLGKAKELFLAVLEMPAPDRAAFLDTKCAGDTALRQRIEAMLRTHENSGELLPRAPAEMVAEASKTEADATAAFSAPTDGPPTWTDHANAEPHELAFLAPPNQPGHLGRLGHYEVHEVIGKGGFGVVLKAFDEKLHRVVAIKVLSPAYAANGSARTRFIREARTAAAVKNEHVVAIYGVEDEAQPPYLVMELIDGISLQDKLDKKGPLSLKEILRIGLQTAEGLAAAHKQGLVHRDIKPANILLENGVERVKITDFGLARAVDDASVTQSGTVAGTPMYMSPEQAEGLPVDHRSDLFSLGTVLYAMCTGHSPFRASGTHAVLKRVIDATPRPIREINSEIPEWLSDVISKLHAKKPEERFQTAREVAELLGQHLAHLQQATLVDRPALVPVSKARPWQVGERVWAPWEEDEWLYPGTIHETKHDSVFVAYDDGATEWVAPGAVRPLDLDKGTRVFGYWNSLFGSGYYPATITATRGNQLHLAYDDGDQEWTEPAWIRIPVAEFALPATAEGAVHSAQAGRAPMEPSPKAVLPPEPISMRRQWIKALALAGMGALFTYAAVMLFRLPDEQISPPGAQWIVAIVGLGLLLSGVFVAIRSLQHPGRTRATRRKIQDVGFYVALLGWVAGIVLTIIFWYGLALLIPSLLAFFYFLSPYDEEDSDTAIDDPAARTSSSRGALTPKRRRQPG